MVPLGVSGSGLLVITVAITIALVLLYVLYRGEAEYEREHPEDGEYEHGEAPPEHGEEQPSHDGAPPGHHEQQPPGAS